MQLKTEIQQKETNKYQHLYEIEENNKNFSDLKKS
jgi:hypothetical protein